MRVRDDGIAIEANALRKAFQSQVRGRRISIDAVSGVTFRVESGSRIAFIGPNGAGKSTSIKMLTGILRPTSGTASVLGLIPWQQRRELSRRIGTLFGQRSQLWFQLSPRRTFDLLARIYGIQSDVAERRVEELGDLLEAGPLFDRQVRDLSLGERMRCELVACLLHHPEVLFLDEPSIGLDLVSKRHLRNLILRINAERGATVVLTSHDVSDIEHVADRVIVINQGCVVYDDSVAQLRKGLLNTKVVEVSFEQAPPDIQVAGARLIKSSASGATLEVDTADVPIRRVLDELLDRYRVVDVSVGDPPLEDVIAHLYGGGT